MYHGQNQILSSLLLALFKSENLNPAFVPNSGQPLRLKESRYHKQNQGKGQEGIIKQN